MTMIFTGRVKYHRILKSIQRANTNYYHARFKTPQNKIS